MVFDVAGILKIIDQNRDADQRRDKFRSKFPLSTNFRVRAEGVREFFHNYLVSDDQKYGIIVGGEAVKDGEHLIELLGNQDEIILEFRHIDWEPGDADEDVYLWLLRFAERL